MFGEDNQLFALTVGIEHRAVVLKQLREFFPFAIHALDADFVCHVFKALQGTDFGFQLCNRGSSGSVIDHFFFQIFALVCGVIVLIEIVQIRVTVFSGALAETFLRQTMLQTLPPAAQRLVNSLRRGCKAALQNRQSKANGGFVIVVQIVRAVELLAHIIGNFRVELGFLRREVIVYRVGNALREQGLSIEFEQFLLHQTPHDVTDIHGLLAGAVDALEAVGVYQRKEQLEIFFLTIVRCSCQQQEITCNVGKQSAQQKALCVFDLTAPDGSGHLVRLITDDQVPLGDLQLFLQFIAARQLVQPGNAQIDLGKNIAAYCGFHSVIGQDFKANVEFRIELVLPLFRQAAGGNNQAAFQIAASNQFFDEQAGHNCFTGTGVVRQNIAQRESR